jgi:hypothetical protein
MNKLKTIVLLATLAFASFAVAETNTGASMHPRKFGIEQRQRNQQRRIAQGVRNGQLTGRETARLERREAGIERREQRMRASGGQFTRGERRAIQRQLNGTSRQIYRQKHDRQHR